MKKRVHYLIKTRMQFDWTLRFLVLTIIFALFIGFEVYITMWPVISPLIPKFLMSHVTYQICYRLLFFSIPIIFVIGVFVIVFTHRFAGPLYRLELTLDRVIQGEDVEPIILRKNDELQDLIMKINELILMVKESKNPAKEDAPPPS